MSSSPINLISKSLQKAVIEVLPEAENGDFYKTLLQESQNSRFGDLQSNVAMPLAKAFKLKPKELAENILAKAKFPSIVESSNIAGPGFINIKLNKDILGKHYSDLLSTIDNNSLGVTKEENPSPVVIDLCGVNVAKQMHVGHLRSTIIGEALANIHTRLGRTVFRENHLGDWGLPIAMVMGALEESNVDFESISIDDLDAAYRRAQAEGKSDTGGLDAAINLKKGPHRVVELLAQNDGAKEKINNAKKILLELQSKKTQRISQWNALIDCTLKELFSCLSLLNIRLTKEHNRGESFYKEDLPGVVDDFIKSQHAREDDGAIVVDFKDRTRPLLIRKKDGGFLYATTDLAAINFRIKELNAKLILYVVDSRQRDHFKDVFDATKLLGWNKDNQSKEVPIYHVPFGSVLGTDKKPLKTRSGTSLTLRSLLEEAIRRGNEQVKKRITSENESFSNEEKFKIGRAVGIGAIKYADLSNDLTKDYVFDLDRMISFEGDTGPYLQYAHARISGIIRKSNLGGVEIKKSPLLIKERSEINLAKCILEYPDVIKASAEQNAPHKIAHWLRKLSESLSSFYETCPVLTAEENTKNSRLRLCGIAKRALADGLSLLGIEPLEKM